MLCCFTLLACKDEKKVPVNSEVSEKKNAQDAQPIEIVEAPTQDLSADEEEKTYVRSQLDILKNQNADLNERLEAFEKLFPYAKTYASVTTEAVKILKGTKEALKERAVDLFYKAKLVSPSIIEGVLIAVKAKTAPVRDAGYKYFKQTILNYPENSFT